MCAHQKVVKSVPSGFQQEILGRTEAASDQIRFFGQENSATFGGLIVSICLLITRDILKVFLLRQF